MPETAEPVRPKAVAAVAGPLAATTIAPPDPVLVGVAPVAGVRTVATTTARPGRALPVVPAGIAPVADARTVVTMIALPARVLPVARVGIAPVAVARKVVTAIGLPGRALPGVRAGIAPVADVRRIAAGPALAAAMIGAPTGDGGTTVDRLIGGAVVRVRSVTVGPASEVRPATPGGHRGGRDGKRIENRCTPAWHPSRTSRRPRPGWICGSCRGRSAPSCAA